MQKLFSLEGGLVRLLSRLTDLLILNTLFLVTSLPIVTIGAAMTALSTMWYRILKGEDSEICYHYFRIFRASFKQATHAWLGFLVMGLVFYLDYSLFSYSPFLSGIGSWVLLPFLFLWVLLVSLIFPYIGRYEDGLRRAVTNSLALALISPFQAVLLGLFQIAVLYFLISSPERLLTAIYLLTFGGCSLWSLLTVLVVNKIFARGQVLQK